MSNLKRIALKKFFNILNIYQLKNRANAQELSSDNTEYKLDEASTSKTNYLVRSYP